MGLCIRDAVSADLAAIDRIYDHYVLTSTSTYQLEPESPDTRLAWLRHHDAHHPVVVAEDDGDVVGWASLSRFRGRAGYAFTVEDSVYVDPTLHGRGIGTRLLEHLVMRACAAGHHTIIAGISADQEASVRLHARQGFEEIGRLREVGRKFEQWLDVVFMQKLL